ncbi:hypothetical protein TcG_04206 [Trypanosoma cruzi]|nr:hypothetical protein TcG_04206 [Trypanosoma cruzi]
MSSEGAEGSASSVDRMNGVGMPVLFISVIAMAFFMTRRFLIKAVTSAFADTTSCLCFFSAVVNMLLSVFLFFSTGFNYGLVSTVLAYCMVFIKGRDNFNQYLVHLLAIYLVWFLVLVGIPAEINHGIIRATNKVDCTAFYNTYASTMCLDGWLTFVKIVACCVLGFTLLSLLLLTSEVLGSGQLGGVRMQKFDNEEARVHASEGRE